MQLPLRFDAPPLLPPRRNPGWLDQMFASRAALSGGVIRRSVDDVVREVGRSALELEVRRRGFHLIECGGQFLVVCSAGPIRIVC
jgi:hypothetical protein